MRLTLTTLVTTLLLFFGFTAEATVYYISNTTSGNSDNNAGTSQSAPWNSTAKVNAFNIQPGDFFLFKRGDVFKGTITPNKSGTSGKPITYGMYGDVNLPKPTFSNMVTLSGWTSNGGGIWTSAPNSNLPANATDLNVVLVNDNPERQQIGRYPNLDATNKGYLTFSNCTSTALTDPDLPAASTRDWTGAEIVIRVNHWVMDTKTVTSHSSTVNFGSLTYDPKEYAVNGYFFENDMKCLDQLYEWCYNAATKTVKTFGGTSVNVTAKTVSMYFGTINPNTQVIRAAAQTEGAHIAYSFITLDGIKIEGMNADGVWIKSYTTTNVRIINSTINAVGNTGIMGQQGGVHNCAALYDSITNVGTNGIEFGGHNDTSKYNYVNSVYAVAGMGGSGETCGEGIIHKGSYHDIGYNEVFKSGYVGINFSPNSNDGGSYNKIYNNFIDSFCYSKDDGGGIYAFHSGRGSAIGTDLYGNVIDGNIVLHGIGVHEGTTQSFSDAEGIYMDGRMRGVTITNNTVGFVTAHGLFQNNVARIITRNNTFFNCKIGMINRVYDTSSTEAEIHGNILAQNIFFNSERTDFKMWFTETILDYDWSVTHYGTVDSNFYDRPLHEYTTAVASGTSPSGDATFVTQSGSSPWPTSYFSLEQYKYKYPAYSVHYKKSPKAITSSSEVVFYYNPSRASVTINLGNKAYVDVKGNAVSGTVTLAPYRSIILTYTGTVTTGTNIAPTVSIAIPTKDTAINENQSVKFTATAADTDNGIYSVKFYNGSTLLATDLTAPYTFTWDSIPAGVYNITAKATDNSTASNNTTTSAIRKITVNSVPLNPTVAVSSPVNNTTYNLGDSITFTATATAATGSTITKILFYRDSTLIHTETTAPYTFKYRPPTAGTYIFSVVAVSSNGFQSNSEQLSVTVKDVNHGGTISITAPANNTVYTAPAAINITASATDSDGVQSVSFYYGSTLIGSDTSSPYSYSWTNVDSGTYNLTARMTDRKGNLLASSGVKVTVGTNTNPTATITAPANNATYTAPATIGIGATATDNGSIKKVDFYNGTTLLGTDSVSPYAYSWTPVAAGTYTLTAKATDNTNLTGTSSAITVTVNAAPNQSPTITLDTPRANQSYIAPATVRLYATASGVDDTITSVKFYAGTTLIGTELLTPFQRSWNNVAAGTYKITAVALDAHGASTTSNAVTITVGTANKAPVVSITSPANGAAFTTPTGTTITASATDNSKVTKVEFYRDTILLGTDTSSPYTYQWNGLAVGTYNITAKAYDDQGLSTTSGAITFSVSNPVNKLPVVAITTPARDTTYQAPVNVVISAAASDSDGTISRVEFYRSDVLVGSDITAPYSYTFNNADPGDYTILVKAIDNNDGATWSTGKNFTVLPVNLIPTVAFITPTQNQNFTSVPATIDIEIAADDTDGNVDHVTLYNGTTVLATLDSLPYSYMWTGVGAGTYNLKAVVTDNLGATATTATRSITVKTLVAPSISLALTNSSTVAPGSYTLTATASDVDGTISKVEFYQDTVLVGTDNTSPYTFGLGNLAAGTYKLTAKATDNSSLSTISQLVTLTITNPPVAPTISLTAPAGNLSAVDPVNITISANASDADGTVKKVEFLSNGTVIGVDTLSPYTMTWSSVMQGTYQVSARATDNSGLTTTTSAVTIAVSHVNVLPSLNWISPVNGDVAPNKGGFNLLVSAVDPDGSIANVRFYSNGALLATITAAPYGVYVGNLKPGSYTFTAVATDNSGGQTSKTVNAKVVSQKTITVYGMQAIIVP